MIALEQVKSSNIDSIGFDEQSNTLLVKFKNGKTFGYEGVPFFLFDKMLKAESVGKFFVSEIKSKFKCEQINVGK